MRLSKYNSDKKLKAIDLGREMSGNIPNYDASDYRFVLIAIPVLLAFSSILVLFMKETHPEQKLSKEFGSVINTDIL